MKETLQIIDLKIGYKKPLTETINLSAYKGSLICIVGRNGTGKSTLLNTISGLSAPLSGKIILDEQNINKIKPEKRARKISYVPSRQEFLSNLKVIDIVTMGRSPYTNVFDKKSTQDKKTIDGALEEFQLNDLANKKLYEVSDGERQRAMICRAFVQETPIILLDEPTAFLDYYAKHKLLKTLDSLAKTKNKCIIFSTHDLEITFNYVNNIWLFNNTKVENHSLNSLKESQLLNKVLSFKF